MLSYELTPAVDADLEEIARYTILEWSSEQARVYLDKLHICFQQIAAKKVNSKTFSKQFPPSCHTLRTSLRFLPPSEKSQPCNHCRSSRTDRHSEPS